VIVIVDVEAPDAPQTLARWAAQGAVGVRLGPEQRSPGADPLAIWRAADQLGLAVSLMGGGASITTPEFRSLVEAFPTLPIVIEHMAGAGEGAHFPLSNPTPQPPFDTFTEVLKLAECPNVYLKMTGLNELAKRPAALPETYSARFYDEKGWDGLPAPGVPPFLRLAINSFGKERIMWGSDFPPVAGREGYRNSLSC